MGKNRQRDTTYFAYSDLACMVPNHTLHTEASVRISKYECGQDDTRYMITTTNVVAAISVSTTRIVIVPVSAVFHQLTP